MRVLNLEWNCVTERFEFPQDIYDIGLNTDNVAVALNGIIQVPYLAYTVGIGYINFVDDINSSDNVVIWYQEPTQYPVLKPRVI
jgi:hypothetical protein